MSKRMEDLLLVKTIPEKATLKTKVTYTKIIYLKQVKDFKQCIAHLGIW